MEIEQVIEAKQGLELALEKQINEIILTFYKDTGIVVTDIYCDIGKTSVFSEAGPRTFVSNINCHVSYKGLRISVDTNSVYQRE